MLSPTASNAPVRKDTHPAARNVPVSGGGGEVGWGDVGAIGGVVRWRRGEDVVAGRRTQSAVLREHIQVEWADDEPGATVRGSTPASASRAWARR